MLAIAIVLGLCALSGSVLTTWAFALAWAPNGLFLSLFTRGALRFPRFLEPVHPLEPVLYGWLGVGLVKRIVETRWWPMMGGFEPPPRAKDHEELLARIELHAKGAEICHGLTFVVASAGALVFLACDQHTAAAWTMGFNLVLNGYPVMLQRTHRWRVRVIRAQAEAAGGAR